MKLLSTNLLNRDDNPWLTMLSTKGQSKNNLASEAYRRQANERGVGEIRAEWSCAKFHRMTRAANHGFLQRKTNTIGPQPSSVDIQISYFTELEPHDAQEDNLTIGLHYPHIHKFRTCLRCIVPIWREYTAQATDFHCKNQRTVPHNLLTVRVTLHTKRYFHPSQL